MFAGSNSLVSEPPSYAARIDYFENSLFPITGEDAVIVPTNVAPLAANDDLGLLAVDTPLDIGISADLLANDSDSNNDPLIFQGASQPGHGSVVDNGNGTLTYVPDAGFQGFDSFTYTISDGTETATATVDMIVGSPIIVWYGSDQTFGALGEPQEWVNVLGNVAVEDLSSLSYRLNGGPEVALRVGADGRRLEAENDFNVELSFDDLDPTAADDTLELIARTNAGETFTRTVNIAYEDGTDWAASYSIDWEQVTDLQDVVQVVDGSWGATADGVRPLEPGYDRLLAIGDDTWDFYEVALSVELHDITTTSARHGSAFAFGMLWGGHTDEPVAGQTPHAGWENSAGFYFWGEEDVSRDKYYGWGGSRQPLVDLVEGSTYNVKVRLEHDEGLGKTYSVKIWDSSASEPTGWLIQASDDFNEPVTGSFLLNAHYFDVTFGDVTVTPIEGSDILPGRDTSDILVAVNVSDALPGQGELDVFTGGAGADTFVFGTDRVVYYDDGIASEQGLADYALIWDFDAAADRIRLAGSAADYVLSDAPAGLAASGTAIWLKGSESATDELIAVVRDAQGLTLLDEAFVYDLLIV
ncbi:MAG: Ig-like domain-containing protein [Pseudomonadota bacterium]